MNKWTPSDIIAVIITITISSVLLIAMVDPLISGVVMSENAEKLIAGLVGSLISIISMYIGAKIQRKKDN